MSEFQPRGLGWLRERPDIRDFWIEIPLVKPTTGAKKRKPKPATLQHLSDTGEKPALSQLSKSVKSLSFPYPPPKKHLKNLQWCSPVEDQGGLGSCTAQAGVGLLEYYELRTFGKHINGSRRFLYKVTRNLLGWTGDTGAYCRTTMAAMALLGVAMEKYWQYTDQAPDFDVEPSSFVYALAQNYQGLVYHRADNVQSAFPLLDRIKVMIAVGWPFMFGFTCYQSLFDSQVGQTGEIPFPSPFEQSIGGHAIVAVGYDDNKKIRNMRRGGVETKGAFLIRNSWGTGWGCVPPDAPSDITGGYGWLPYEYLARGLASDWWTLTKAEYLDCDPFGL